MSSSTLLDHDLARGVRLIAGVDEVGRACLAGPIMAAGVLFDLERLASGAGGDLLEELNARSPYSATSTSRTASKTVSGSTDSVSSFVSFVKTSTSLPG